MHRPVALKVIKPGMGSPEMVLRFERERRLLALMDHPGIARIFGAGHTKHGHPYFAMELIRGVPVTEYCQQRDLTARERVALLLDVCSALAHAHQKSVVHRDLKPHNILVCEISGKPLAKIIDFGLARALVEDTPGVTANGRLLGTPETMSPEQVRSSGRDIDTRTDIYALGAVLYEVLTGTPPLRGLRDCSELEMQRVILEEEPELLSARVATLKQEAGGPESSALAPSVLRGELDWIVKKALEKEVEYRYQSAFEMASDLKAYLEDRPVLAGKPSIRYRVSKFVRRHRTQVLAVAAVLLIFCTAFLVTIGALHDARGEKLRAERNARDARKSLERFDVLGKRVQIDRLLEEANRLYPAWPERAHSFSAWLAAADPLIAELEGLMQMDRELRASALSVEYGPHHAQYLRAQAALEKMEDQDSAVARKARLQVRNLEYRALQEASYRFAEGADEVLFLGLEELLVKLKGLLAVRRRMARDGDWARTVEGRSIRRWKVAWDSVRRQVKVHPDFGGFDLPSQIGLVPLGPDPETGLPEFAHVRSGALPVRDFRTGRLRITGESALVFVLLPGGPSFVGAQASDASGKRFDEQAERWEGPVHEVRLAPFFISKYEMTQGQWYRLCALSPSRFGKAEYGDAHTLHPVESVSWHTCDRLLRKHGLNFPTEAQWEYAARAGSESPYWFGTRDDLVQNANLADRCARERGARWPALDDWKDLVDGHALHAPVDSFAPNAFGLYNVHGNVWEFCLEPMYAYDQVTPESGTGRRRGSPHSSRVRRGGGYECRASKLRSSGRTKVTASYVAATTGVRPVRPVLQRSP